MQPVRKLCLAGWLAVAACAQRVQTPQPSPMDLSALEARRAAHPSDPRTLADVGVAFYRAGAYARSRDALSAALALEPRDFRAAVHLGLADEGLGDFDAALAAYRTAGELKVSRAERRIVEERLVSLTHQRLALMARRAIAQERTLAAAPPLPNSIAVLPWTYLGANPDLRPLERGLAHLFLTDLAKLPRFTLLERERTQALIDELALTASARVAPATAARSGMLLGADQVLSGVFRDTDGGALRLDANLVRAATAEVRATGDASDRLEQLFAMEKTVLFELLDRMAVPLTPAERRALAERPTADIQSFLAFSRGLEAEDRGDFRSATGFFDQAATRDPSFVVARQRATRSSRLGVASRVTAALLSAVAERPGKSVRGTQLAAALQNIAPSLAGRLNRANRPTVIRSRLAEALRQDDASRIGLTSQGTTLIPRP
jgi:TolB-like protein